MDKDKTCPLLYMGWLSFQGRTDQESRDEILCSRDDCQLWNNEAQECGLIVKISVNK
jgi:hypothetical protein